ncbi:MAG TPA: nuclear transport factor 2 family protein [Gemmatimonadaceae bacterium]|nr:nuclear transport factor 2 family protein [Gemmatimonadaceae bacterium]
MRRLLTVLILLAGPARLASAQSAADSAAIRATALDYIEGWYAGDAARMERALHPELAKRIVETDARGRSRLGQQSAMTLVTSTRRGGGTDIPAGQRKSDVRILDVYGNAASVRVQAATWVDYLHIAKSNGRWVIVNVLWELEPQVAGASR